MGGKIIAGVVGILACAGLIWVGIGFAGFAFTAALTPWLTLAGAAALAAFLLLIVPVVVVVVLARKTTARVRSRGADNFLVAMASVARERPILAMLGAALFGAGQVFLKSRKKKPR
ncbi:MAG TPA: hypothetical protein VII49_08965 [Rhizomicrobium sp.]